MKNEFKVICGIALAAAFLCAGRASAEIAVGIDPVAHMPAVGGWGAASRASVERLEAAAERLSAAVGSGDAVGASAQLASLYSGSALKGGPAPVYAARPAPAVPAVSAPVQARPAAVPSRYALKSASEELGATDAAGAAPEASKPAAAEAAAKEDAPKGEEKPMDKLWETALAFAIGMAFVLLIVCLL